MIASPQLGSLRIAAACLASDLFLPLRSGFTFSRSRLPGLPSGVARNEAGRCSPFKAINGRCGVKATPFKLACVAAVVALLAALQYGTAQQASSPKSDPKDKEKTADNREADERAIRASA